jgi:glycosyltransferase involved in cell wall biosynthesis
MKISVALCTYNGALFLEEQLQSISAQTLLPDELVVCDDVSSDATLTILERFASSAAFDVRLFRNKQNLGSTKNFDQAIGLCQGELIALSDQDDVWHTDKLSRMASVLDADPTLGGVFSNAEIVDQNSNPLACCLWSRFHYAGPQEQWCHIEKQLAMVLLKHDVVTGATMMFRAELRNRILPISESWAHDAWITWMLVLYSGIAAITEPLMAYRVHETQQLGLAPSSFSEKINSARQIGRSQCMLIAVQFEKLRDHWVEHPGKDFKALLSNLDGKINNSYLRGNLPQSRLKRVWPICNAIPAYYKYANGFMSICRDLLI